MPLIVDGRCDVWCFQDLVSLKIGTATTEDHELKFMEENERKWRREEKKKEKREIHCARRTGHCRNKGVVDRRCGSHHFLYPLRCQNWIFPQAQKLLCTCIWVERQHSVSDRSHLAVQPWLAEIWQLSVVAKLLPMAWLVCDALGSSLLYTIKKPFPTLPCWLHVSQGWDTNTDI